MTDQDRIDIINASVGYVKPTEDELRWICPICGEDYNNKKESFMLHQEHCFDDHDNSY